MSQKLKIGMLGLMLDEYNKSSQDLKEERTRFALDIVRQLNESVDVHFFEIADTRGKVEQQVRLFEYKQYDGIIVVFLTYSPSLISIPSLVTSSLPIVIWNTQTATGIPVDALPSITRQNHGVHGVQDLTNTLNRVNKPYLVITSHYMDIANLNKALKAVAAVSRIKRAKIGLLGHSMQDMGDFNVDETALSSKLGVSIRHIFLDELVSLIRHAQEDVVRDIISQNRDMFQWDLGITREEEEASSRMEWAIRELIKKHKLDGWAQHFMALGSDARINTLPFLAASKLMDEGIGYGAEGDVTSAIAFILVMTIAEKTNFTEMFSMDFDDGSLFMKHMGEGNIGFAKDPSKIRIARNCFNMVDVLPIPTPVFAYREGPSTLMSFTSGYKGQFKIIVASGNVTGFPGRNCAVSPEFKWQPEISLEEFLNDYAYAGGSHHQAMAYGDITQEIKYVGKLINIEVIKIC